VNRASEACPAAGNAGIVKDPVDWRPAGRSEASLIWPGIPARSIGAGRGILLAPWQGLSEAVLDHN
jgi:hypothetical protein